MVFYILYTVLPIGTFVIQTRGQYPLSLEVYLEFTIYTNELECLQLFYLGAI